MNHEKQIILKKLGENGIVLNGTCLIGMIFTNQELEMLPIVVFTSCFAGSCYLLYKGKSPYQEQKKTEQEMKKRKIYQKKPHKS